MMARTMRMIQQSPDLFGRFRDAFADLTPDEMTDEAIRDAVAESAPQAVDAASTPNGEPMSEFVIMERARVMPQPQQPGTLAPMDPNVMAGVVRTVNPGAYAAGAVDRLAADMKVYAQRNQLTHEKLASGIMAVRKEAMDAQRQTQSMFEKLMARMEAADKRFEMGQQRQDVVIDEARERLLMDAGPAKAYGGNRDKFEQAAYKEGENWLTGGIVATDQPAVIPDTSLANTVFTAGYSIDGRGRLQGTQLCTVWAIITGAGNLLQNAALVNVRMTVNDNAIGGVVNIPLQAFAQTLVGETQRIALGNIRLPASTAPVFRLEPIQNLPGIGQNNTVTFFIDAGQSC